MRDVTLTDAQRAQVWAINDRYRTQRRALQDEARAQWRGRPRPAAGDSAARAAFSARASAWRARARDLRQRQLAEVRAVLTPAQQASFDRNLAEMRARGAERAADRAAGRGVGRRAGGAPARPDAG
jgi:Spy/CpxP family protein refolding chaperone